MVKTHKVLNRNWYWKHRNECLEYGEEYRRLNREAVARWRKAHPEDYEVYKKKQAFLKREQGRIMKREVMTHYGNGKCACVICGESRLACLSIDHINGGGTKERRDRHITSYSYYLWLKNQGYPDGHQTLCMNCQFVKRFERNENKQRKW